MTETKETADRTLRGDTRKPLSLKRTVESGHVRQSFSHGRSKSVVVEKKKKRTISGPGGAEAEEPKSSQAAEAERRHAGEGLGVAQGALLGARLVPEGPECEERAEDRQGSGQHRCKYSMAVVDSSHGRRPFLY